MQLIYVKYFYDKHPIYNANMLYIIAEYADKDQVKCVSFGLDKNYNMQFIVNYEIYPTMLKDPIKSNIEPDANITNIVEQAIAKTILFSKLFNNTIYIKADEQNLIFSIDLPAQNDEKPLRGIIKSDISLSYKDKDGYHLTGMANVLDYIHRDQLTGNPYLNGYSPVNEQELDFFEKFIEKSPIAYWPKFNYFNSIEVVYDAEIEIIVRDPKFFSEDSPIVDVVWRPILDTMYFEDIAWYLDYGYVYVVNPKEVKTDYVVNNDNNITGIVKILDNGKDKIKEDDIGYIESILYNRLGVRYLYKMEHAERSWIDPINALEMEYNLIIGSMGKDKYLKPQDMLKTIPFEEGKPTNLFFYVLEERRVYALTSPRFKEWLEKHKHDILKIVNIFEWKRTYERR